MNKPAEGRIIAAFGRHYEVALHGEATVTAFPPGKKSAYACGDVVALLPEEDGHARIVRHLPRASLLYRSDGHRQKLIAANATQLILVVATQPSFSMELLSRALVAAECEGLRALIVLNKMDLGSLLPQARALLGPLHSVGYPVLEMSALQDASALAPFLAGELSVLVGQSGMGKSTLVNVLAPDAAARTGDISLRLHSGRHTTTYARLYRLENGGGLIDSPGLQEFGLAHLPLSAIEQGFVELRPHVGRCRFRDCRHRAEPDCAVKRAVDLGEVHPSRYEHYLRLTRNF